MDAELLQRVAHGHQTIQDAMGEIARRVAATVPALERRCHYPYPSKFPNFPALFVFGSTAAIVHGAKQEWATTVSGHLAVSLKGAMEKEQELGDRLVTEIVDAFDNRLYGDNYRLGSVAQHCRVTAVNLTQLIEYGGHKFYGHEIQWDVQLHRRAR